ncbi:MAG TPA: hypothetical protein PKE29_09860 [Phycisphaerales bacterium]|nr:hypothetical protein [Phycisphaerales bacterium]
MSAADTSKELSSLLKTLRGQYAQVLGAAQSSCVLFDPGEPLLGCFLKSFMLWESTTAKAAQAIRRIEAALVDFNELRACMPDEIVGIIGERYPRATERALRMRTALNIIYSREHRVTLEPIVGMDRSQAREHFDRLDGVPAFVASRVCLCGLAHHAAPVDSRIHRRLIEAKLVHADSSPEAAAALLEKKSRPGELLETYTLLQAWADDAAYTSAESHLSDLRPRHKPVAEHIRKEQEARRKAARRAKLGPARALRKKKAAKERTRMGKKKPR